MVGIDLRVKQVSSDQIEWFCSILTEASLWLEREGQPMWTPEQVAPGSIMSDYSPEEMYLGYVGDCPAATMVLQEVDDVFWPNEATSDALFLHKLSVRRQFARSGLARGMVGWAIQHAREHNKPFLRLDCAADRPKLCSFYESQGFIKVREKWMFDEYPTAFYEISV